MNTIKKINQYIVNCTLDTAVKSGYSLNEWSAEEIVDDLISYDYAFEDLNEGEIKDLLPLVKNWINKK